MGRRGREGPAQDLTCWRRPHSARRWRQGLVTYVRSCVGAGKAGRRGGGEGAQGRWPARAGRVLGSSGAGEKGEGGSARRDGDGAAEAEDVEESESGLRRGAGAGGGKGRTSSCACPCVDSAATHRRDRGAGRSAEPRRDGEIDCEGARTVRPVATVFTGTWKNCVRDALKSPGWAERRSSAVGLGVPHCERGLERECQGAEGAGSAASGQARQEVRMPSSDDAAPHKAP